MKTHGIFILLWMLLFLLSCPFLYANDGDSPEEKVSRWFLQQQYTYPQEKLYVHNDKPCYIAGEDIWFRAYLTDYVSGMPDTTSRYVYGELINPIDSVVLRVKIRPEGGTYSGHFTLPQDIPEGDYHLRFYTRYMQGTGEEYFFRRKISIGTPLSALYRTEAEFVYSPEGKTAQARLRFITLLDGTGFIPKELRFFKAGGKKEVVRTGEDGVAKFNFNTDKDIHNRTIYIEYDYNGKFQKQFITLPAQKGEFDVAFFPEGGELPAGTQARMGFKALNAAGVAEVVTGEVFNAAGEVITSFTSNTLGMGSFIVKAAPGEVLTAVCTNTGGTEKRFNLPPAKEAVLALQAVWSGEVLTISLAAAADIPFPIPSPLHLVIHTRGNILYNKPWDNSQKYLQFRAGMFPSGVLQILLTDGDLVPISERLVFNMNTEEIPVAEFQTDKEKYARREKVNAKVRVTSRDGFPLKGSFSVSVTDDRDITPDNSNTILSALLLTSELKGYVEKPGWYFEEGNTEGMKGIDDLLLTQGWTRYDVKAILKGDITPPEGTLEVGPEIAGKVSSGFFLQNKGKGYSVTLLTFKPSLFETAVVDEEGRYRFNHVELPDSTHYILQALSPKGGKRCELFVDEEVFPAVSKALPPDYTAQRIDFENFVQKAEQKYTQENGMRTIYLDEFVVTGRRKGVSPISVGVDRIITLKEIQKKEDSARNLYVFLKSIGDLNVTQEGIFWNNGVPPVIIVDEIEFDEMNFLSGIRIDLPEEIELVRPKNSSPLAGKYGFKVIERGALILTSKARDGGFPQREGFNKKIIMPLGYQVKKEFYTPRYETPEDVKAVFSDLRTTIYWNPDVRTSPNGETYIDFYTADAVTSYTVIIEGLTTRGELIRKTEKITRK